MPDDVEPLGFALDRIESHTRRSGKVRQYIHGRLSLRNTSPATACHVHVGLRTLSYDSATQTIVVGTGATPPTSPLVRRIIVERENPVRAIAPGETIEVPFKVPLSWTRIIPSGTPDVVTQEVDASKATRIAFQVLYSRVPPPGSASERPHTAAKTFPIGRESKKEPEGSA